MIDKLILTVVIEGENIMSEPLLKANGSGVVKGKKKEIRIETPITSVADFVEAFENMFKE